MRRRIWGALACFLVGTTAFAEIRIEKAAQQISLHYEGVLIAAFRTDGRLPCIYPLVGPTGNNVTRHFPLKKGVAGEATDHPHHLSFWMAHGSVNGHDFWHSKGTRIEHRSGFGTRVGPDAQKASITVDLYWMAGENEILTEERTYLFDFSQQNKTVVDVTSVLKATNGPVVFGDTKEGTFALRVTPTLRLKGEVAQGQILDAEGRVNDQCWGKRSRWIAYHGPDSEGQDLVIALMDHRQNLRHPTWWHARDYGLLAANPFGQHDFENRPEEPKLGEFTLEEGKSLTLRYKLVLQAGKLDGAALQGIWTAWE